MALAHVYIAVYPAGSTDPKSTATYGDPGEEYHESYTSMSAMEAAENGDLTDGDGTVLHVEIIPSDGSWNGAPDATSVVFDGWKTDRSGEGGYVSIQAFGTARSSTGLYSTAAYILQRTSNSTLTLAIDNDFDFDID